MRLREDGSPDMETVKSSPGQASSEDGLVMQAVGRVTASETKNPEHETQGTTRVQEEGVAAEGLAQPVPPFPPAEDQNTAEIQNEEESEKQYFWRPRPRSETLEPAKLLANPTHLSACDTELEKHQKEDTEKTASERRLREHRT